MIAILLAGPLSSFPPLFFFIPIYSSGQSCPSSSIHYFSFPPFISVSLSLSPRSSLSLPSIPRSIRLSLSLLFHPPLGIPVCSTIYVFRRRSTCAREYMQMPSWREASRFFAPLSFLALFVFHPSLSLFFSLLSRSFSRCYCFYRFFPRWLRLSHLSRRDINKHVMLCSCAPRQSHG